MQNAVVKASEVLGQQGITVMQWIIAYIAAAIAFGILDAMWLSWAGPNFYRPRIGEVMAESFKGAPAAVFYVIYIAGMVWFAIRPGLASGSVATAVLNGALLGALVLRDLRSDQSGRAEAVVHDGHGCRYCMGSVCHRDGRRYCHMGHAPL